MQRWAPSNSTRLTIFTPTLRSDLNAQYRIVQQSPTRIVEFGITDTDDDRPAGFTVTVESDAADDAGMYTYGWTPATALQAMGTTDEEPLIVKYELVSRRGDFGARVVAEERPR